MYIFYLLIVSSKHKINKYSTNYVDYLLLGIMKKAKLDHKLKIRMTSLLNHDQIMIRNGWFMQILMSHIVGMNTSFIKQNGGFMVLGGITLLPLV